MSSLPKHIALIMDGNRRWAKKNHLSLFEGHRRGEEMLEPLIDTAIKIGIPYLTFWAFSTENWYRDKREVDFLLNLFRHNLDRKVDNFHRKNFRLNIIGNLENFPADLINKTKNWMEKTKNNKVITVNIALSYGGRDEIIRAIKKLSNHLTIQSRLSGIPQAAGQFSHLSNHLTVQQFSNFLDTADQPDPDLLIR